MEAGRLAQPSVLSGMDQTVEMAGPFTGKAGAIKDQTESLAIW